MPRLSGVALYNNLNNDMSAKIQYSIDEHTYQLEKIRIDVQTAISIMPEFFNEVKPRIARANANGKDGIWITTEEIECANVSCTQIMATLLKGYDILIDSARLEKIQTKILEDQLCRFLEKELNESLNQKSA